MDPLSALTVGSMAVGVVGQIFGASEEEKALKRYQKNLEATNRRYEADYNRLSRQSADRQNQFYKEESALLTKLFRQDKALAKKTNKQYVNLLKSQNAAAEADLEAERFKLDNVRMQAGRERRAAIQDYLEKVSYGLAARANQGALYGSAGLQAGNQASARRATNLAEISQEIMFAERIFGSKQKETAALTAANTAQARIANLQLQRQTNEKQTQLTIKKKQNRLAGQNASQNVKLSNLQRRYDAAQQTLGNQLNSDRAFGQGISNIGKTLFDSAPQIGKIGTTLFS